MSLYLFKYRLIAFSIAIQVLAFTIWQAYLIKRFNAKTFRMIIKNDNHKKQVLASFNESRNNVDILIYQAESMFRSSNFSYDIAEAKTLKVENHSLNNSSSSANCLLWKFDDDWDIKETPEIQLDPNKFLYPGLDSGPNNQVMGLEKTMIMSIILNRTFVIPSFRSHYKSNSKNLSPHQIINVKKICSFISCISEKEFQEQCNHSFGVLFQGQPSTKIRVQSLEQRSGMPILRGFKGLETVEEFPFARVLYVNDNNLTNTVNSTPLEEFPSDLNEIRKSYESHRSCGVMIFAMSLPIALTTKFPIPAPQSKNLLPLKSVDDLRFAVTQAVERPSCIVDAAKHYIKEVLGDLRYIGIHWRYDENDFFGGHCNRVQNVKERYAKICKYFFFLKPVTVARAINKAFNTTVNSHVFDIPVYIAVPPSISDFRDEVYQELFQLSERYSKPKMSLESFLLHQYELCWQEFGWTCVSEIISLTEMELMTRSSWFFYAHGSSWSAYARHHRLFERDGMIYKKFEKNNLDLVFEELNLPE